MANKTTDSFDFSDAVPYQKERILSNQIIESFYAIEFYQDSTTNFYEKYTSPVLLIKEDNRQEGI